MGEGLGLHAVECKSCNGAFYITTMDGMPIGKYICPHCGVTYTEQ